MSSAALRFYIVTLLLVSAAQITTSVKQQSKETSGKGFLDLFKLKGDIVPSTYPVLKFNQGVNNDATFSKLREREIGDLQEDILRLMPLQRQSFQRIRQKLGRQINLVDELAVAMERQE